MKKTIIAIILTLCTAVLFAQDKEAPKAEKPAVSIEDKVYSEIVLEDFEKTAYSKKNINYTQGRERQASIAIRDSAEGGYAAPFNNSKKYLGLKMYAKKGDFLTILPEKELKIDKYCKSIGIWVYGKNFSGQLSILIQDIENTNYRLVLGTVDFLGWRKMVVKLPKNVKQQDEYLNQKGFIKITKIIYRPGNMSIHPKWQYFYIDDITARVRDKYTDRQSDDW